MISHHTLIKYMIDRSMLFQNNINTEQEFLNDFQTDQKQIQILKKIKFNLILEKNKIKNQQLLVEESIFKIYLINYISFFLNMFTCFVLNKRHAVCYFNSDIL